MSQPIEMVRGTTNTIRVTVSDEGGNPYRLKSGEKLIFGVKPNINHPECCIKKIVTGGTGEFSFKLTPEDTESLTCRSMCYDVGLQSGTDYFSVIPCSPFVLTHNVTRREV